MHPRVPTLPPAASCQSAATAMGAGSSRPDKTIEELPGDERYYGLENFGADLSALQLCLLDCLID